MDRFPTLVGYLLAVGLLWGLPRPTLAVIVSTGVETSTPPDDDFGWSNVGVMRNATAIYLGDRWVLSAYHIGDIGNVPVQFPGLGTFEPDRSTVFRVDNPPGSGLTGPTDLVMFQLIEDPGLPPLEISSVTPTVGTEVWVVGHGLAAAEDLTYWDVSQRGATWTWTETPPPGDYSGYQTISPSQLRWGTNLIEDDETFKNEFDDDILTKLVAGQAETRTQTWTLLTEFDRDQSTSDDDLLTQDGSSATAFESQAVLWDSGGGMFVKVGDRWQLAGTILSVEGHRQQPDVTRNAIFGNLTYYADLATYADEIRSRVRFGDFDGDLTLTAADVDRLIREINQSSGDAQFDLTRDGTVTRSDLLMWVNEVYGTYFGDANLDGEFGTTDLIQVLQAGEYEDGILANSTWSEGDWNGDPEFNSTDFVVALQAGGYEAGPRGELRQVPVAVTVPEPAGWMLGVVAAVAVLGMVHARGHRSGRTRVDPN